MSWENVGFAGRQDIPELVSVLVKSRFVTLLILQSKTIEVLV